MEGIAWKKLGVPYQGLLRKTCLFFLVALMVSSLYPVINVSGVSDGWQVKIQVDTGDLNDWVLLAEDSSATDGPPGDSLDTLKPPAPPSPYLYVFLDDNLPYPNDKLIRDFRGYPDTEKTWNLTIIWMPTGSQQTVVCNITWDPTNFTVSEYSSVHLKNSEGLIVADMRNTSSYTFTIPSPGVWNQFSIVCEGGRTDNGDGDGDSDGDGDGGGDVPPPVNQPPVAKAEVSDSYGSVGELITFDGSGSTDDVKITNYTWDFDDGSLAYGMTVSHVFTQNGSYTVTLTVMDAEGETDDDSVVVVIGTGNHPPVVPSILGEKVGHQNQSYLLQVVSSDVDNDTIQYVVHWGDSTSNTSDFLPSGSPYMVSHHWGDPGVYQIMVTASDGKTSSEAGLFLVCVDAVFVEGHGYLLDDEGDGVYDRFYSNVTKMETLLGLGENQGYLIDVDGDGTWDYMFNAAFGGVSPYDADGGAQENEGDESSSQMWFVFMGLVVGMIVIGVAAGWVVVKK